MSREGRDPIGAAPVVDLVIRHAMLERLIELVCPRCSAMNRPGALIIEPVDPLAPEPGLVVCGVCGCAWQFLEGQITRGGDRRRGLPDRRLRQRRSNWTAATGRRG